MLNEIELQCEANDTFCIPSPGPTPLKTNSATDLMNAQTEKEIVYIVGKHPVTFHVTPFRSITL